MKALPKEIFQQFRTFFHLESASGLMLIGSMVAALAVSNSPLAHAYFKLLETHAGAVVGGFKLEMSILHWINDGLMAVFFLVVGLEIKREMVAGELASIRRAALPIVAALGGMVVPALIFTAFNGGGAGARGWGIPMATDIAFALGILSLLGDRVPPGLKIFLAALAIIDDLGAVLVIAVFYTGDLSWGNLGMAGVVFAALLALNKTGVRNNYFFVALGLLLWFFTHHSGVHGTIAGVLLAMTIPAGSHIDETGFAASCRKSLGRFAAGNGLGRKQILDPEELDAVQEIIDTCIRVEPPLQRLERRLHPWTSFIILPVFALANAGISVDPGLVGSMASPVSVGILLGLVAGKPIGIFLFTWLSVRLGWVLLPREVLHRHVLGVGLLGGIGFTMSIFISGLAFGENGLLSQAKLSVFIASATAGVAGWLYLRFLPKAR